MANMQEPKHAIKVAPAAHGWAWELINCEGVTSATGVSADQADAFSSAWRAATSYSTSPGELSGDPRISLYIRPGSLQDSGPGTAR
jgi:hypothetical protein